jgi:hypothetical protein
MLIPNPRELDEAAIMDGASPLRIFFFVILPLLRPPIVTVVVTSSVTIFNDFVGPPGEACPVVESRGPDRHGARGGQVVVHLSLDRVAYKPKPSRRWPESPVRGSMVLATIQLDSLP